MPQTPLDDLESDSSVDSLFGSDGEGGYVVDRSEVDEKSPDH